MANSSNLTLFALPKAFEGRNSIIQRNSIKSWTLLNPRPEIILFGTDRGTKQVAEEFGLRHVPEVACNKWGTPLVNDLFERAQQLSGSNLFAYINSDIILFDNFISALESCLKAFPEFLMVGRRWNIDLEEEINFNHPEWRENLRQLLRDNGFIFPSGGIDYFCFTRGFYSEIPPFAIGRTAWDNWLIWDPMRRGKKVIDATSSVLSIHHNHDYNHVPGPKDQPFRAWTGEEGKINQTLAGPDYPKGDLRNAVLEVRDGRVVERAPLSDPTNDHQESRLRFYRELELLTHAMQRNELSTALGQAEKMLRIGQDYPGLRHKVGLLLSSQNREQEGAQELLKELELFPGRTETRKILTESLPAAALPDFLRSTVPDMHCSELKAIGAVFAALPSGARILDLTKDQSARYFANYCTNKLQWSSIQNLSGPFNYDLAFLPVHDARPLILSAWKTLGAEGVLVVPSCASDLAETSFPEVCFLVHFQNPKVVTPQATTGGFFLLTPSKQRCEMLTALLENQFRDCLVQRRLSALSSTRWSSQELAEQRQSLENYSL